MAEPLDREARWVPMRGPDDCLSAAVASIFGVALDEVPYCTPADDWDGGWKKLMDWCTERGWRINFVEDARHGMPFSEYLAQRFAEPRIYWIASVHHESWPADEAHALVMFGDEIAYDPAKDTGTRPPLSELIYSGAVVIQPIDPAPFLAAEQRAGEAERERDELRALVIEAYPGEHPTNRWRMRAEKLNAWPGAPQKAAEEETDG